MQFDKRDLVSDKQNLAQAAGAYLSDHSIDLMALGTDAFGGTVSGDVGKARQVDFLCQVTEDFASAGAATVQAQLVTADDAGLTSNVTVLRDSGAIAKATLVAGYRFAIGGPLPEGINQRYLGVKYTIGTATTTAGKVTAGVVLDRQTA